MAVVRNALIILFFAGLHFGLSLASRQVAMHYYWTPVAPGEQEQSLMLAHSAWTFYGALSFPLSGFWNSLLWAAVAFVAWRAFRFWGHIDTADTADPQRSAS